MAVNLAICIIKKVENKDMKFKMNNREWEIIELSQEEIRKHIEEYKYDGNPEEKGKYFGQTYYDEQKIYLDKDLHKEQKRQTLMHELMHCYIGSYLATNNNGYTEEYLCDISANSHDIIHKIVEDYFKLQPVNLESEALQIFDTLECSIQRGQELVEEYKERADNILKKDRKTNRNE